MNEAILGYESAEGFDAKERAILRFVDAVGHRPHEVGEDDYRALREHLSEDEVVEVLLLLVNNITMHVFFSTLDFYPMFDREGNLVTQEESRRIYGDTLG